MPPQVDVESAFADFVRRYGGEVVEDLVGASPDFKNADYLFRSGGVVAELKRLVEDKSEDENIKRKVQQKFDSWISDGTVGPIYGRVRIQSNTLPEKCQRELMDIYKPPIRRRIIKANKQIKATIDRFRIQNGKGLLIVVNDGNYALEADAVLYLINRILGENFQQINSIVYCTVNMFAQSPMTPKPTLFWANASRASVPCVEQDFVMSLFRGWSAYLAMLRGESIEQILLSDPALVECIRYAREI
jgi:hypothetical protein